MKHQTSDEAARRLMRDMWRIFLAGTVRLLIAAGGGWLAVAYCHASLTALFAIVAAAIVISAAMCVVTELSGAMWPRSDDGAPTCVKAVEG